MRSIRPLKDTEYRVTKMLFQNIFDISEDNYFVAAWKGRNRESSVGIWEDGALLGATVVKGDKLEYIFVSDTHQGGGLGRMLLEAVLAKHPVIHLIPVKDPRVIRWYESYGFRVLSERPTRNGPELLMIREREAVLTQKREVLIA